MVQDSIIPTLSPNPAHLPLKQETTPEEEKVNWNSRIISVIGITAIAVAISILISEIAILINEMAHDQIWRPNPQELEKKISEKFSVDFINKLKDLSKEGLDYVYLFKHLALSQEEETEVISYLEKNFELSSEQLKEILMGAHVRLDDNGQTYQEWTRKIANKQTRISSHASNTTQYSMRGSLVKELLFSRTEERDEKTYTWFQLENHPLSFGHIIRHMKDYIKYKITDQNQGPYGSSKATDRKPIILKIKSTII